jgi:hypothetical protein
MTCFVIKVTICDKRIDDFPKNYDYIRAVPTLVSTLQDELGCY